MIENNISEDTGLTLSEESIARTEPAMVLQENGLPATPQTAFNFIKQGKLQLAMEYVKALTDPSVKIDLAMAIREAAINSGLLDIATAAAGLIGMKLADDDLLRVFQAWLDRDRWHECRGYLEKLPDGKLKRRVLDLLIAKGEECGEIYREK